MNKNNLQKIRHQIFILYCNLISFVDDWDFLQLDLILQKIDKEYTVDIYLSPEDIKSPTYKIISINNQINIDTILDNLYD